MSYAKYTNSTNMISINIVHRVHKLKSALSINIEYLYIFSIIYSLQFLRATAYML